MASLSKSSIQQREEILSLLSDEENARVGRAEESSLIEGDEFIDLLDLKSGVHQVQADTKVSTGTVLPRSAVSDATWARIIKRLN